MEKIAIGVIGAKAFPAYGGAAGTVQALILQLEKSYDITVYLNQPDENPSHIAQKYRSIVFNLPKLKRLNTFIYYLGSCCHALLYGKYDIIHVQHLYSGFIIPFLKLKFKTITTVHGIIPADDNKWNGLDKIFFRFIEKLSLRYSDRIISVSKPQIPYLQQFTRKKILYIPNGVSISARNLPVNESSDFLTFSAARVIELKGCDIFLKALREINYKGPIKIIGDLNHVRKYKHYIHSLAKDLAVTFLGLIKDKDELFQELRSSKYFIFPSTKEGLSNMLLEVAALGVPIICSDIEENRAIFDDNEVLYFKNRDHKDLGAKILFGMENTVDMQLRASRAFDKVNNNYQWKQVAIKYSVVFDNL